MISFKSVLALISVNVSTVKENVDNEYRRLTQVENNFENKMNIFFVIKRIVNKNLIIYMKNGLQLNMIFYVNVVYGVLKKLIH